MNFPVYPLEKIQNIFWKRQNTLGLKKITHFGANTIFWEKNNTFKVEKHRQYIQ